MSEQNQIVDLAYKTYGDPHLPPIILLMGLGTPAAAWPRQFIADLVQGGLYVIVPDNRDSGASPAAEGDVSRRQVVCAIARYLIGCRVKAPYRLEDMAADVFALMDRLGLEKAAVAGISMGGMIAQCMAIEAPQRVSSLVCMSTACGNPRTGLGKLKAVAAVLPASKPPADAAEAREALRKLFDVIGTKGNTYPDDYLDAVLRAAAQQKDPEKATARQLMAILASGNRVKALRQLFVPALVVHGLADPLLPKAAGMAIAKNIRGARFLGIEGMGHDLPPAHIDEIARAVAAHCYGAGPDFSAK